MTRYHRGATGGTAGPGNRTPPRRGRAQGWTRAVARRFGQFLMSVDPARLTGEGYAVTLTVRDAPATAAEWHRLRRVWQDRVRRLGLVRMIWTVEVQRRGTPHLHCTVYLDEAGREGDLAAAWVDVAAAYGPRLRAQYVVPLHDEGGWAGYLLSHSNRSVTHYQRDPERFPPGWRAEGSLGRMWGAVGDWAGVTIEPERCRLDWPAWWCWRRRARGHLVARARGLLADALAFQARAKGARRSRVAAANVRTARRGLVTARRLLQFRGGAAGGTLSPAARRLRSQTRGITVWAAPARLLEGLEVGTDVDVLDGAPPPPPPAEQP